MYIIFMRMQLWLAALMARPCPPDVFATMSPRELADLPVAHPRHEPCGC